MPYVLVYCDGCVCGGHYQKWLLLCTINVMQTINCSSTLKLPFWVISGTRVKFQPAVLSGLVSWGEMSNVGLLGKQHHHLEALSANQEAPVLLRGAGGWGGVHVPAKATYCVLVLFISNMEKGTWTGSDLTHSHTALMQLLSGVNKTVWWQELHAAKKLTHKDGCSINYSVNK